MPDGRIITCFSIQIRQRVSLNFCANSLACMVEKFNEWHSIFVQTRGSPASADKHSEAGLPWGFAQKFNGP
jgi:hypothetical protein